VIKKIYAVNTTSKWAKVCLREEKISHNYDHGLVVTPDLDGLLAVSVTFMTVGVVCILVPGPKAQNCACAKIKAIKAFDVTPLL